MRVGNLLCPGEGEVGEERRSRQLQQSVQVRHNISSTQINPALISERENEREPRKVIILREGINNKKETNNPVLIGAKEREKRKNKRKGFSVI